MKKIKIPQEKLAKLLIQEQIIKIGQLVLKNVMFLQLLQFMDIVLDLAQISPLHVILEYAQKIHNLQLKKLILECVRILELCKDFKRLLEMIVGQGNLPILLDSFLEKKLSLKDLFPILQNQKKNVLKKLQKLLRQQLKNLQLL